MLQMRVTPSGVEFLEAIDCSLRDWREGEGEAIPEEDETPEKDAKFIADTILAAVKRQSDQPPVAIFMDNAAACLAAGKLLESDPHLRTTFFVPCASHCLDLLIEDIAKIPQFAECIAEGKAVVNFIRNHQWALGKYRNVSKQVGGKKKALLKPGNSPIFVIHSLAAHLPPSIKCNSLSPSLFLFSHTHTRPHCHLPFEWCRRHSVCDRVHHVGETVGSQVRSGGDCLIPRLAGEVSDGHLPGGGGGSQAHHRGHLVLE